MLVLGAQAINIYPLTVTGVCRNSFFTNGHSICFEKDIKTVQKVLKVRDVRGLWEGDTKRMGCHLQMPTIWFLASYFECMVLILCSLRRECGQLQSSVAVQSLSSYLHPGTDRGDKGLSGFP